jgi:hypothetical protein
VTQKPVLTIVAFNAAMIMAFVALALSFPTYAPKAEATGLWTSIGCGAGSAALVATSWPRVPRGVRPIGVATVAMGLLGLFYSVDRLMV